MDIAINLVGGLALLTAGGESLVRGAQALALRLGLTPLIVGLTVVAFGTSSPELAVSVDAAVQGLGDVAIGNVVGSNICNIALILGLAAMIRPLQVHAQIVRLDVPLTIGASLLLVAMLADGTLGRAAGLVCVLVLAVWIAVGIRLARRESRAVASEFDEEVRPGGRSAALYACLVIAGLAALFVGGRFFVGGAVDLARNIGVSEAVVGLTIVAVGTSLPELVTSLIAAVRAHGDIAVGNVVGSNIFNLLGILGIAALVRPLETGDIGWTELGMMVGVAVILAPIVRTGYTISRGEGIVLVTIYVAYTIWLFARPA